METSTRVGAVEVPADQLQAPIVPVERRRPRMTFTLHVDTEARLTYLALKYQTGRGQLIDKLVATLYNSAATGVLHCIHGHRCSINRTDVPVVF